MPPMATVGAILTCSSHPDGGGPFDLSGFETRLSACLVRAATKRPTKLAAAPSPAPGHFQAIRSSRGPGFLVSICCHAVPGLEVTPIRVLIGPMPGMLRAIVDDLLANEPDLIVVGCSDDPESALVSAREARADMLITQSFESGQRSCLEAILTGPPLSIFAIEESGHDAAVTKLDRRPIDLSSNAGALAAAIRRAATNLDPHRGPGKVRWLG